MGPRFPATPKEATHIWHRFFFFYLVSSQNVAALLKKLHFIFCSCFCLVHVYVCVYVCSSKFYCFLSKRSSLLCILLSRCLLSLTLNFSYFVVWLCPFISICSISSTSMDSYTFPDLHGYHKLENTWRFNTNIQRWEEMCDVCLSCCGLPDSEWIFPAASFYLWIS